MIVLINAVNQMEIESLKTDDGIDAIMWIGYPGVYGFEAVAQALKGDVNPSGRLGNIYAVNSAASPAVQNYGTATKWTNVAGLSEEELAASKYAGMNVNSYLVEAEGIYTGYRYYETRYADSLLADDPRSAVTAKAGSYTAYDAGAGTFGLADTDGEWIYNREVSYPFGYGLSYTTFTQNLDSVEVSEDRTTAVAKVTVTNTGEVAGKSVVQLYAQLPYEEGDVQKSAIQLVDYEKTELLQPDASETVTLNIDMSNLASYDYEVAKTFRMDAGTAKAGSYTAYDAEAGTFGLADTDGEWIYNREVSYPFGYGLSYTTFTQNLDSVEVSEDRTTAVAKVTVTNTGEVAGKSVVQLYAQLPYEEGDVQKSAIQLVDYEKTELLQPDASETVTLNIDMSNLASYDYEVAKTFRMDAGTYYFAIGESSHDALNNVLSARQMSGMVNTDGTAFAASQQKKVEQWTLANDDTTTFAKSDATGADITNRLTEGDYATDANAWIDQIDGAEEVVYLTRSDWNGTFPKTYSGWGIKDGSRLDEIMLNDFIPLGTNEDISDLTFGDTTSELTFADMKGVPFDDPRWQELVEKIPLSEIMNFMANAFHNIEGIPSIGFAGYAADDGPGGSDSHDMGEASNQGTLFADARDFKGKVGTRIAPSPMNLAYTWNKVLAYENGEIILGESTLLYNLPIMIGPGMNIHRTPYNGRNVEYYSEDPILSGFTGSAVVQGAQENGCLVNIKHVAFNTQEADRAGVCELLNEQAARELELRNLQQAFTAKGRSPKMTDVAAGEDPFRYEAEGARGTMTAYNRIGMVASSANAGVQMDILRGEWGFDGYSVTDFTGLDIKAAPKESVLAGTTAFCGFGGNTPYWTEAQISGDADLMKAMQDSMHYALYALSNSYAMDLVNTHPVDLMTWWRAMYISLITISSVLAAASVAGYVVFTLKGKKEA